MKNVNKSHKPHHPAARRLVRRGPNPMALEQRFMFDGAAVADAAHAADAPTDNPLADVPLTPAPAPDAAAPEKAPAPGTTPSEALIEAQRLAEQVGVVRPVAGAREVLFIDSAVADKATLIAGTREGVEIVILDAGRDAWVQMTEVIAQHQDLDAVHLVSHGSEGTLLLGGQAYDAAALQAQAASLDAWQSHLSENADILVYGCDVAAGADGQALISSIARLTSADVAASTDATGAAGLGGDWVLESRTGGVEAGLFALQGALDAYDGKLRSLAVNLTTASDTGTSSSDKVTSDNTPTISFSNVSDSARSYRVTFTPASGSATSFSVNREPGSGKSYMPTESLADGTYVVKVETSSSNTFSTSSLVDTGTLSNVVIDTTKPGVPIISSVGGTDGTVSSQAGDKNVVGKAEANSTVTIKSGNVTLGTTIANDQGNFSYDLTADNLTTIGQGSGKGITATATDKAGNEGNESTSYSFAVDTVVTPGTLSLTNYTDSGSSSNDFVSTDKAFDLSLSGNETGSTVVYQVSTNGGTSWTTTSATQSNLSDATYKFRAQVTDAAGNTATTNELTVKVDTSAPSDPLVNTLTLNSASDSGSSQSDKYTKDTTPTLTIGDLGKVTLAANDVIEVVDTSNGYAVVGRYQIVASDLSSGKLDSSGRDETITLSALSDGTHKLKVRLADLAGNAGALSDASLDITIDTTSTVAITSVTIDSGSNARDFVTNDNKPVFKGSAEAGATVKLTLIRNGARYPVFENVSATADENGNWSVDRSNFSAIGDGTYKLSAEATDKAGNVKTVEQVVVIDTRTQVSIKAVADDTGSSRSDFITKDTQPVFSGTAETGSSVVLTLTDRANTKIFSATVTADKDGNWSLDRNGEAALADGTYTLTAVATDVAGNTETDEQTVKIDTTAPKVAITAVVNDTDASGDFVTSDNRVVFSGTAEAGAKVLVSLTDQKQNTISKYVTATDQGTWSWDLSGESRDWSGDLWNWFDKDRENRALADGTYTLTAVATDKAGNSSAEVTQTVVIDTALHISSLTVNEGSPYAIFTVTGVKDQTVDLRLASGTLASGNATVGVDTGTVLQYFDASKQQGSQWVTIRPTKDGANIVRLLSDGNGGGKLLVRVAITNDNLYEGPEQFTLNGHYLIQVDDDDHHDHDHEYSFFGRLYSYHDGECGDHDDDGDPINTTAASGVATIYDDGRGNVYLNSNTTGDPDGPNTVEEGYLGKLDNDTGLTIDNIVVNEASQWAVFKIEGAKGKTLSLRLGPTTSASGNATLDDANHPATADTAYFASGVELQIFQKDAAGNSEWVNYTRGTSVFSDSNLLIVRARIVNDGPVSQGTYEGPETFQLWADIVTAPGSVAASAVGIATIVDDGSGDIFNATGGRENKQTSKAVWDDDRALKVSNIQVNEGSPWGVFTVSIPAGSGAKSFTLAATESGNNYDLNAISNVDANDAKLGSDFNGVEYFDGTKWTPYTGGTVVTAAGQDTLLVRVKIVNEGGQYEGPETFKLQVTDVTAPASPVVLYGTATIFDDGTGSYWFDGTEGNAPNDGRLPASVDKDGKPITLDDDSDLDGISPDVEKRLADLAAGVAGSTAKPGDLNGDGIEDSTQKSLATLAWTTNDKFNAGLDGTLTDVKPIISLAVTKLDGNTVDTKYQLENIQVLPTTGGVPEGNVTGGRPVGVNGETITAPWDPIQFTVVKAATETSLVDVDGTRSGTQIRIVIDISRAGMTTDDFNAYMKYVTADALAAAANDKIVLRDLDGKAITAPGWYDFTQRTPGGDGARFILGADGKTIIAIELTITDNAFGDDSMEVGKVVDPGTPVHRTEAPVLPPPPILRPQAAPEAPRAPAPFEFQPSELWKPMDFLSPEASRYTDSILDLRDISDILTRPGDKAFRITVVKADDPSLYTFYGVSDQVFDVGSEVMFQLPSDTFAHTRENETVRLMAQLADGGALPKWLHFDPATGIFSGKPPVGTPRDLAIKVTALDTEGRKATTTFRIKLVPAENQRALGRAGLSEQIRAVGQRSVSMERLGKIERLERVQAVKRAA